MTNSIAEIEHTDCMFIIGSNPTEAHPVLSTFMKRAAKKGAKVIVVDPRKIEMAEYADAFLQIKPGTNIALINAICHVIYKEGRMDQEYIKNRTADFDEFIETIEEYTPARAAEICEVAEEEIIKAARLYSDAEKAGIYYCLGVTEHVSGVKSVMSLAALAMMTGNVGIESAGVNPIRGQNNVQGACDMGALPADFPGYQKVIKKEVVEKFESAWGVPLSSKVGLTLSEMFPAAIRKDLKALYIMGENSALSDPDLGHIRKALQSLDFLVVQDLFLTETAAFADVVLPACSFAEKNGTFTNTERRVQRVRKAIDPVHGSKQDWRILVEIAEKMGYHQSVQSTSEVFDEMASLTPSYSGMNYQRLEKIGLQWPCTDENHPGTRFLHKDQMAIGRGIFMGSEAIPSAEETDQAYPLLLSTGRNLYQYNVINMTGKTEGIQNIAGWSYVEMSPTLADAYHIQDGDMVELSSRRGSIKTKAVVTDNIRDNILYMPFHYAEGAANELTNAAWDPISKTPEYKVAAVRMSVVEKSKTQG